MEMTNHQPSPENAYLREHAELLISSYRRCTGKELVQGEDLARALFEAPYGVLSHNTDSDPIFTYGNQTALRLFEVEWNDLITLPSRTSAEPINQAERERLLARVKEHGFIDDYSGVRISSTGKRFRIENATVWNVINPEGLYCGQAAMFTTWSDL